MLLHETSHEGKRTWYWWCEGCNELHIFDDSWQFDGNMECPTLSPSILTRHGSDPASERRCHVFIKAGQVQYLSDCHHALAGQTRPLLPIPPGWFDDPVRCEGAEAVSEWPNTITFIGVENWGEDGNLFWAPGHHDPTNFIKAVERWHDHTCGAGHLDDLYGTCADEETAAFAVAEARADAITATQQRFGRYTVPEDLDPQWADNPWDSEQVRIHFGDELEPGGFPITYWTVN